MRTTPRSLRSASFGHVDGPTRFGELREATGEAWPGGRASSFKVSVSKRQIQNVTEGTSGAAEFNAAKLYVHVVVEVIALIALFEQRGSDDEIAKRALSVLRWKIRYESIRVQVEKGHMTLSGEVNWYSDRAAAEHTVRKLSGVIGVTNLITTVAASCLIDEAQHQRSAQINSALR